MELFDVYLRYDVTLKYGKGPYVYDEADEKYLDLYGGHGVISIGHSNPHYVDKVSDQIRKIGFYSNSVHIPEQEEIVALLGKVSGYDDYSVFLANSGAEANENALKLASFHTSKKSFIAFKNSFHGRTGAALNVTDNPKISAPLNRHNFPVHFLELNDFHQFNSAIKGEDIAGVIIEGIQGVGGLDYPSHDFLKHIEAVCKDNGVVLILDEIQSGYGRTGKFFAHQHAGIKADLISVAKGMGNGFPIGGVIISPNFTASAGLLGTTFGGNQLACAAGIAVLEVIDKENLIDKAAVMGAYAKEQFESLPEVKMVKGFGLMLGIEFDFPVKELRGDLVKNYKIFSGAASNPNLLRILPPLNIEKEHIDAFVNAVKEALKS